MHSALSVQKFLDKNSTTFVSHPPHTPDLASYNFFPKLKLALKLRRFDVIITFQNQTQSTLVVLKTQDVRKGLKHWREHWPCCIRECMQKFPD